MLRLGSGDHTVYLVPAVHATPNGIYTHLVMKPTPSGHQWVCYQSTSKRGVVQSPQGSCVSNAGFHNSIAALSSPATVQEPNLPKVRLREHSGSPEDGLLACKNYVSCLLAKLHTPQAPQLSGHAWSTGASTASEVMPSDFVHQRGNLEYFVLPEKLLHAWDDSTIPIGENPIVIDCSELTKVLLQKLCRPVNEFEEKIHNAITNITEMFETLKQETLIQLLRKIRNARTKEEIEASEKAITDFWEMQKLQEREQIYETLDKLKEEGDNKGWHVMAEYLKTHWPKELKKSLLGSSSSKGKEKVPDTDSAYNSSSNQGDI